MREHPDRIGDVMHLVGALRNLERLADHATNIAEDVIFLIEAREIRSEQEKRAKMDMEKAP